MQFIVFHSIKRVRSNVGALWTPFTFNNRPSWNNSRWCYPSVRHKRYVDQVKSQNGSSHAVRVAHQSTAKPPTNADVRFDSSGVGGEINRQTFDRWSKQLFKIKVKMHQPANFIRNDERNASRLYKISSQPQFRCVYFHLSFVHFIAYDQTRPQKLKNEKVKQNQHNNCQQFPTDIRRQLNVVL